MREILTAHDFANTIRMLNSAGKTCLLVEGDTDVRVYKRFVEKNSCQVISARDKETALEVLNILEKNNFNAFLVIVDADFGRLDGGLPSLPHLFFTDTHDLESMIMSNEDVMEKILDEWGHNDKMKQLRRSVIDLVLEGTMPIGLLRWLASSARDNIPLRFRDMDFEDENLFDQEQLKARKLKINIDQLLDEIEKNSKTITLDKRKTKKKLLDMQKGGYDPWQVCCGHDMVQVLAVGLRVVFGNKKNRDLKAVHLERALRLSYEYSHFQSTGLWRAIRQWEKNNPGSTILGTPPSN